MAKDGHVTLEPKYSSFSRVVSRESIRIALTCASLNDSVSHVCVIQNACLQAPSSEKHYVVCGLEFGLDNAGKHAIIVRAMHSRKSDGADY